MANVLNISALSLNPKEVKLFSEIITEGVFLSPTFTDFFNVREGVTMKEQIVIASQLGKTGLASDSNCTRKSSGATSVFTQKYLEPVGIEDTIVQCQASVNSLFKSYFDNINEYKQKYDITGTDEQMFLSVLVTNSMTKTVNRAVWFGDKETAQFNTTTKIPGLVLETDIPYYNYFDGIWKQVFQGVTASKIGRYTISENTADTSALQLTLTSERADEIFEEIWDKASPLLKAAPDKYLAVSGKLFNNYRRYLQKLGGDANVSNTQDGFPTLKWNGVNIVNMETVWDNQLFADFKDEDGALYLPNRAILTTKSNFILATLNSGDMDTLEVFYDQKPRELNIGYGFNIDTKIVEESMIVVAY